MEYAYPLAQLLSLKEILHKWEEHCVCLDVHCLLKTLHPVMDLMTNGNLEAV